MDATERQLIDELFGKVRQAESQTGPRDADAEAHIARHVAQNPAAPYYMSQAIVVQEQALVGAQARIEELEQQLASRPAGGGGFLSSLFGGGQPAAPTVPARRRGAQAAMDPRVAGYMNPHGQRRGGFLGDAMSTAMGVAGGMLLGSMLASAFMPDPAAAAEEPAPEDAGEEDMGMDEEF
jgi:hypothetical protein